MSTTPTDPIATVTELLAWLPGHRRDGHAGSPFARCPGTACGDQSMALVNLVYTFERCNCPAADYVHLVEQIWHRTCHVVHESEQAAAALAEVDKALKAARFNLCRKAAKALRAEAQRGEEDAPPRQQLTYAGGLRRAAVIVDGFGQ